MFLLPLFGLEFEFRLAYDLFPESSNFYDGDRVRRTEIGEKWENNFSDT